MRIRKMEKRISLGLLLLILVCGLVLAPEEEIGGGDLSYDAFLENPTPENFNRLNLENQRTYLFNNMGSFSDPAVRLMAATFVDGADFEEEKDFAIANNYFMDAESIKGHEDAFESFMSFQGVHIEMKGEVLYFDHKGNVKGKNQELNLYDFTFSFFTFEVDEEGNIKIIDHLARRHSFEGKLSYDEEGEIYLEEGYLDDHRVEKCFFLFTKEGVEGKAQMFKVRFEEETSFSYSEEKEELSVSKGAKIEEILEDITIRGEKVSLPGENFIEKGGLTYMGGKISLIGGGSDVIVDGFNHVTDEGVDLIHLYAENEEILKLNREEEEKLRPLSEKFEKLDKERKELVESWERLGEEKEQLEKELIQNPKKGEELRKKLADNFVKRRAMKKKINALDKKHYPYRIQVESIKKEYDEKRSAVYPELIKEMIPEKAYFIQGEDRIWLGGEGFTSKVKENNRIFPEFTENDEEWGEQRKGRLKFSPKKGHIEVIKISADGRPLALHIKTHGTIEINNGKWNFEAEGGDIYGGLEREEEGTKYLVPSDMRIEYLDEEGKRKIYDLDVDATFKTEALSEEERIRIEANINQLEGEIDREEKELYVYLAGKKDKKLFDHYRIFLDNKEKIEKLREETEEINKELLANQRRFLEITDSGSEEAKELQKRINEQSEKIDKLDGERGKLEEENLGLEYGPFLQDKLLSDGLQKISNEYGAKIDQLKKKIEENRRTGAFGQVISSEDGDTVLSFEEFLEGYPVVKNTDIYQYSAGVYNPRKGITEGGKKLRVPLTLYVDQDRMNYELISTREECVDTLWRMGVDYAEAEGKDIQIGKYSWKRWQEGGYGNKEDRSKQSYLSKVFGYGTSHYWRDIEKGEGFFYENIEQVDIDKDSITPGTVLLEAGHAMMVKEVLEIPPGSGKKYYRTFSSSLPAIDPKIDKSLKTAEEIKECCTLFRFKFKE